MYASAMRQTILAHENKKRPPRHAIAATAERTNEMPSNPDPNVGSELRDLQEGRARIRLLEDALESVERGKRALEDLEGLDALMRGANDSLEHEEAA